MGRSEATMKSSDAVGRNPVEVQLGRVHWHILRGDSLRGTIASRAGTLLSTNALVVAGIALAVGLGNHRPSVIVIVATAATFACVFGSVTSAVLATVSLFHWDRQFPDQAGSAGTVYSFVEHGSGAETFEDFKHRRATESPEQVLDEALRELWQISQLHRDRYRWLRRGQRWLFVALLCLLITVGIAVS
ncbi:MAG TPA: hypothetical protein VHZ03_51250 [Trebonia sp.]|nr:hypothetical protein [Trebonia sp.]